MSEIPHRPDFVNPQVDFADLPQPTKPYWQMTKAEFNDYCGLLVMGFSGHLTEENEEHHIQATTEEGLKKRKAFLKQFVPPVFHNKIDQITWYDADTSDLMERVHASLVEQAVNEGLLVPNEVVEQYPKLREKIQLQIFQKEKEPKINSKIIEIIKLNFDKLDLSTNRNSSRMEQEFSLLFSKEGITGIKFVEDVEYSMGIFTDTKTGIDYITPFRFASLSRKYLDSFELKSRAGGVGRSNLPIWQGKEPAVVIRQKEQYIDRVVTIRKGLAEVAD